MVNLWKHPCGAFVLKSVVCFCNGRCIKSKCNSCSNLLKRACAQCLEGVLEISISSKKRWVLFTMSQLLNLQMLQPPVPRLTSARVRMCVGWGQGGIVVSERVRSSAPLTPHRWETRKGAEWSLPSASSLWDSTTAEPNALADTAVYSAYPQWNKPHLYAVVVAICRMLSSYFSWSLSLVGLWL